MSKPTQTLDNLLRHLAATAMAADLAAVDNEATEKKKHLFSAFSVTATATLIANPQAREAVLRHLLANYPEGLLVVERQLNRELEHAKEHLLALGFDPEVVGRHTAPCPLLDELGLLRNATCTCRANPLRSATSASPLDCDADDDTKTGLRRKFLVMRADGSSLPGGKHHGCQHFVLDLNHDPYAAPTLRAYAYACGTSHPALAVDLNARADELEQLALFAGWRTCAFGPAEHHRHLWHVVTKATNSLPQPTEPPPQQRCPSHARADKNNPAEPLILPHRSLCCPYHDNGGTVQGHNTCGHDRPGTACSECRGNYILSPDPVTANNPRCPSSGQRCARFPLATPLASPTRTADKSTGS